MIAGVFDSGIGGLTVLKSLLEANLFEKIIYYGDTARVPYGTKDKNTIIRYSLEALEFFKNFKIDMFIAACNTVSAHALDELSESTDIPIIGVIEPGVLAVEKKIEEKGASILVLGTKATVRSGKYKTLLYQKGYDNVEQIASGLFIPIGEEGIFKGAVLDSAMEHYFKGVKKPSAIILGCTHFPLIGGEISRYWGGVETIHSGEAIVEYLCAKFELKRLSSTCEVLYFASENPESLKSVAKNWLN